MFSNFVVSHSRPRRRAGGAGVGVSALEVVIPWLALIMRTDKHSFTTLHNCFAFVLPEKNKTIEL